jgi:acyl carrier protein
MAESTFERLRDIIVEHLGVEKEKVTPDASFTDDLNADSLDLVDLMMTIEEQFGLGEIPDEDTRKIGTVQDAVDYIEEHAA